MGKVYKVNNYKDLTIGFSLLLLVTAYTSYTISSPEETSIKVAIISVGLFSISAAMLSSYFLVKEIRIEGGVMTILPIGVSVDLESIVEIKASNVQNMEILGKTDRIEMNTSEEKFRWIPMNLLWIQGKISIRTVGVKESTLLYKDLST